MFKTFSGSNKYYANNSVRNIFYDSLHVEKQIDTINNYIKNELTDLDFFNFVEKFDHYNTNIIKRCSKLLPYVIKKSYTQTLDELFKIYPLDVINVILEHTDNIDLYIKYYTDSDITIDYCLSLFYENGPSQLSNYIINNCVCSWTDKNILQKISEIMDSDKICFDKNFHIFKYVIGQFYLTADINKIPEDLFELVSEDDFMKIIKLLFDNVNDMNKVDHDDFVIIISRCSLDNIKVFISEYGDYINLKLILKKVCDIDKFLYLINLVGLENIDVDFFINGINKFDDKIIRWLIDYGFKIRPTIGFIYDIDTIIYIIADALKNNDFNYININTRVIIEKLFKKDGSLDKILNIMNIKIFDSDVLFEIIMIEEDYNIWHQLFPFGTKLTNINNIINDLKLLKMQDAVEYIEHHSELFY